MTAITRWTRTAAVVVAAQALLAGPALAGVVVLKNGKVIVGKIDEVEDGAEELTVRWPKGVGEGEDERGEMVIPLARVRWYDRDSDQPTDAYWKDHVDAPIADEYLGLREKYVLRQKRLAEVGGLTGGPATDEESARMAAGEDEAPREEPPQDEAPLPPDGEGPAEEPAAPSDAGGGCGQSCSLSAAGGRPLDPLMALLVLGGLLAARRRAK